MVEYQKLRDAEIFKNLSEEVLQALAAHCRTVELTAGEILLEQNTPGSGLYVLETGQVHIVRQHPDGEQVILATEAPYYVVGELSLLAEQLRTGSVVAVSDCTLIALEREAFAEVCEQHPELPIQVMAYLARRLYRLNLQAREYAIGNVQARVATLLVLLSGGKNGPVNAHIRVSRMARAAATDGDVVERILQGWAQQGIIDYEARAITVHDIDMLRDIAG
ncbi:MAG: Crp/Fnr family transcriptional regulator [Anaerolineae bacterium]|nr:Crp/Fnr family transcriptional regulator [Anaerolineae bacterium]